VKYRDLRPGVSQVEIARELGVPKWKIQRVWNSLGDGHWGRRIGVSSLSAEGVDRRDELFRVIKQYRGSHYGCSRREVAEALQIPYWEVGFVWRALSDHRWDLWT
jgi:hypothetical protein